MAHLDAWRSAASEGGLIAIDELAPVADVAVVGGGWAGLAAAVELTLAGRSTILLESAPSPGGRARALRLSLAGAEVDVDNGQHLLLGAYRESLRIAAIVGDGHTRGFVRSRLRLDSTDGMKLACWPLPAPWHLAGALASARGLGIGERLAIARLFIGLRSARWRCPAGETVDAMLTRYRQPRSLRRRLWSPLVVAALNTSPEQSCAATFARVLRDSLGADSGASDFVLPATTLSQLLPDPARRWLGAHGAALQFGTTVRALDADDDRWRLATSRGEFSARSLLLALPPYAAARLLAEPVRAAPEHSATIEALRGFAYDSIATVYLAWPAAARVALPGWTMLEENPGIDGWGQWLFDRGTQRGLRIASVIVSARGRLVDISPRMLAVGIARQVSMQLRIAEPADARAIVEKRATFRCTPDRPAIRPDAFVAKVPAASAPDSPFARLALAGDYAYADYPATLEGAVRAGVEAARLLSRR